MILSLVVHREDTIPWIFTFCADNMFVFVFIVALELCTYLSEGKSTEVDFVNLYIHDILHLPIYLIAKSMEEYNASYYEHLSKFAKIFNLQNLKTQTREPVIQFSTILLFTIASNRRR